MPPVMRQLGRATVCVLHLFFRRQGARLVGPVPLHPLTPTHQGTFPERCVSGVVLSAIRWVEGYKRLRQLMIK